jgi:hypothetical protein
MEGVNLGSRLVSGVLVVTLLAAPAAATVADASPPWYPVQSAAFAARVLSEAPLPPGAQLTTVVVTRQVTVEANPIRLHGYGETHDADRLYTAPAAPASVVTFIEHHLPKGWWVGVTSPPNGPPPPGDTIVQVEVPVHGPHEETATVSYTVVPDGTGTELRIDALVIWQPSRPRSLTAPRTGSIVVTGYTDANLMGNPQRSTTVRVSGRRAEAIRRAFDRLPLSSPSFCMENSNDFKLTFVPAGATTPALRVVQWSCPSPGIVESGSPSQRPGTSLASSCALSRAVVAVLPPGSAPVTRQAAAHCHAP